MTGEFSILNTEERYEEALARIEALMDLDNPTQAQEEEQEALGRLVEAYEDEHYPIGSSDPEKPAGSGQSKTEKPNLLEGSTLYSLLSLKSKNFCYYKNMIELFAIS